MSALNNFNLIGFCKEQRTFQTKNGQRSCITIEVQMPTKTGACFPMTFEVILPAENHGNFKDKDIAIAGTIGSFANKAGFLSVVLNASSVQVLGKGGSQTAGYARQQYQAPNQPQSQPQPQDPSQFDQDNLPF